MSLAGQLSRVQPGRGALLVTACAALSLTGLVRSGLAGDAPEPGRDPVVLAPPKVADPELGGAAQTSSSSAGKGEGAPAKARTKTCVTVLGQKITVPRDFKCPKRSGGVSNPAARDVRSGKIAPPVKARPAPGTTQPAQPNSPQPTVKQTPVVPVKPANPGGAQGPDE